MKETFEEFERRLHCSQTSFDELARCYYEEKNEKFSWKDVSVGGIINWVSIQPNNTIEEIDQTNKDFGKLIAAISRKMEANEFLAKNYEEKKQ